MAVTIFASKYIYNNTIDYQLHCIDLLVVAISQFTLGVHVESVPANQSASVHLLCRVAVQFRLQFTFTPLVCSLERTFSGTIPQAPMSSVVCCVQWQ